MARLRQRGRCFMSLVELVISAWSFGRCLVHPQYYHKWVGFQPSPNARYIIILSHITGWWFGTCFSFSPTRLGMMIQPDELIFFWVKPRSPQARTRGPVGNLHSGWETGYGSPATWDDFWIWISTVKILSHRGERLKYVEIESWFLSFSCL